MAKRGHEAPHLDPLDPSDLSSHSDEAQLRIGGGKPGAAPEVRPQQPGLELTDKEAARVERLKDTGIDEGTAVQWTTSRSKANRIIGHHHAQAQVKKLEKSISKRESAKAQSKSTDNEIVQLLRDTDPDALGKTEESPSDSQRVAQQIMRQSMRDRSEREP